MPEPAPPRTSTLSILAWAAFLACSWTWCIGMFLPVLLLRDFGPWAILVFAVPNMAGAALMGVVLANPQASARLVAQHSAACRLFSQVTLTFQCFFMTWLLMGLGFSMWGLIVLAAVAGVIIITGNPLKPTPRLHATSWLIFTVSLGCMLWWLIVHKGDAPITLPTPLLAADLPWLAPVIFFGFLLCPYLDLSFHQARQSLPAREGTIAFAVGFLILFAVMLLFTYLYASPLLYTAFRYTVRAGPQVADEPVTLHMGVQLAFTIAIHAAFLVAKPGSANPGNDRRGYGVIGGFIVGAVLAFLGFRYPGLADLSLNEVFYRCFMAFYGLVFPAYVWLCIIPTRDGKSGPTRPRLAVLAVALALAAPMFWMGFIERETWWLAPGLGVVLLARLSVRPVEGGLTQRRSARSE